MQLSLLHPPRHGEPQGQEGGTWNEKKQTKKLEYLKEEAWLAHGLTTDSKLFVLQRAELQRVQ